MNARDWKYAGEGGTHVLFAHHNKNEEEGDIDDDETKALTNTVTKRDEDDDSTLCRFFGCLLNITKADLALSEWAVTTADSVRPSSSSSSNVSCSTSTSIHDPVWFLREIVARQIGDAYVDVPKPIHVNWSFVRELRAQTLAWSNLHPAEIGIPSRRRPGWCMTPTQAKALLHQRGDGSSEEVMAWLVPNYKLWRSVDNHHAQRITSSITSDCLAIEIKPKAGYRACSPLVDPLRRVKYRQSRFQLLQSLFQQGLVEKPWSHQHMVPTRSAYDPIDLFSNDVGPMERAITALLACPQNNLKVWCRNQFLIGPSSNSHDNDAWKEVLAEYLSIDTLLFHQVETTLARMIATILQQESLLSKLLKLQSLDVIDGDGAILIYRRLVELCHGSHQAANELLDDYCSIDAASLDGAIKTARRQDLLSESPFPAPSDNNRVRQFCSLVKRVQELLLDNSLLSLSDATAAAKLDDVRDKALRLIQSFNRQDCQYLLQNWLLSLTMSDVSFFITCRHHVPPEDNDTQTCKTVVVAPTVILQYELKVIDCDRKPAKKLQNRMEKEQVFNHCGM
jgi:hypothetical protein